MSDIKLLLLGDGSQLWLVHNLFPFLLWGVEVLAYMVGTLAYYTEEVDGDPSQC